MQQEERMVTMDSVELLRRVVEVEMSKNRGMALRNDDLVRYRDWRALMVVQGHNDGLLLLVRNFRKPTMKVTTTFPRNHILINRHRNNNSKVTRVAVRPITATILMHLRPTVIAIDRLLPPLRRRRLLR